MSGIPAHILKSMTQFRMPGPVAIREPECTVGFRGTMLNSYRCSALVLGSGAAGLRAAVELKRKGVDVVIVSSRLFGGTSACSGSDKQTLHTAGSSNRGDDFVRMAGDIASGGCMDIDIAYIESVGSIYASSSLQYLGLPLPHDSFGGVLRYRTDHDEAGRATSCGPLTSRLMTKVLCEEAIRLDIPFITGCTGIKILTRDGRAKGLVVVRPADKLNSYGLGMILCDNLILATGGPGELYRDSVYPKGCFSGLGMAIEAGARAVNLTESQFGISTGREGFPWNLSGTYVQVMPCIYSLDEEGQEHNFLADYYRTTGELASNVFRKGYQWPFQAQRIMGYGSSLVDVAVAEENRKGRKVYMDFNRNPEQVVGDKPFSLDDLDDDVRDYLENNNGLANLPIDRLRAMNPLAIELYKSHGIDITSVPLEFSVNNQHLNGGLEVDKWGRTSIGNCYAVGENAGTHGVTRPGGSALNAGQVFGARCAQHIVASSVTDTGSCPDEFGDLIAGILEELSNATAGAMNIDDVKAVVQTRMSDRAGFICRDKGVAEGLQEAIALNKAIAEKSLKLDSPAAALNYFNTKQLAILSEAVLAALDHYIGSGGGSRGARIICDDRGSRTPRAAGVQLDAYRFREENPEDRNKVIVVQYNNPDFIITEKDVRKELDLSGIFFEKNWGEYLTGDIFR